jgi:CheY-like chemotaxis protein
VQKDKKPRWEGTFLVADDEKPVRDMVVRMLRSFGVQTVEASNGHEAVEHVRNLASSLRIVFLDMTMPKLSGNEAYPALRKLQPTLPVVIMSGFAAAEVITGLDDNQQVTFLQKPFSKADLVKAIESLLGPAAPT